MRLLDKAIGVATEVHSSQTRKCNGSPYILHPLRVLCLVAEHPELRTREEVLCAAVLHDVVEDFEYDSVTSILKIVDIQAHIKLTFGDKVSTLVEELTNSSIKYPNLPRSERIAMNITHLSKVSREARIIKMFDRLDNVGEIGADLESQRDVDRNWANLYLQESYLLYEALKSTCKPTATKLACELGLLEIMLSATQPMKELAT